MREETIWLTDGPYKVTSQIGEYRVYRETTLGNIPNTTKHETYLEALMEMERLNKRIRRRKNV